jgi:hypothetical protein
MRLQLPIGYCKEQGSALKKLALKKEYNFI